MSQSLLDRAIAYMHQSQWAEASNLLEAALKADPTEARALRLLGTTRFMSDRPHEAVELMRSSVAIDPNSSSTHQNLGTVYLALGRTAEALDSFQSAVRLDPESTDAHFNLGVAHQQANRLEEATQQYEETLAIDPGFTDAQVNLAAIYLSRGQYRTCIDVSTTFLEHSSENYRVRLCRSRAYRKIGYSGGDLAAPGSNGRGSRGPPTGHRARWRVGGGPLGLCTHPYRAGSSGGSRCWQMDCRENTFLFLSI